ncbi:hypothetical protein NDA03_09670 [Trichocoleus sp. Lan]|uniref:hypothetical protein n=1 Tax=Trichocoleus sp. Lan TaxID=2933927 RepID=UPI003298B329
MTSTTGQPCSVYGLSCSGVLLPSWKGRSQPVLILTGEYLESPSRVNARKELVVTIEM